MTLGERIAALRKEHKLSQDALGALSGIGSSQVRKLEKDMHSPRMSTLMQIAIACKSRLVIDFDPIDQKLDDAYWIGRAQKQVRP